MAAGEGTDKEIAARLAAFQNALKELGWSPGTNLQVDVRFGVTDDSLREKAKELVGLTPDIVLAMAPPSVIALRKVTHSIPIVFAAVTDPVGLGIVQSLSHPGGNATGFLSAEFGFGGKLLEVLKEISPTIRKVIVFADLDNRSGAPQFAAIQAVAPAVGVEVSLLGVDDRALIERRISDLARSGNGGLIALRLTEVILHRELIIKLAAKHRVPAVYPLRIFTAEGGLISYGPDVVDQFRQAASYVDRILKGEKPADLPVQAPTKYNLVINLKTAKAIGLTVPTSLLARANEVIE
ncbi:MAG TPA: ABC transporter substrate-binding protein [Acidobacteriota bacterium]|nr:ABC transporter substrate-binding protein [Acidobacteriota bacterium]